MEFPFVIHRITNEQREFEERQRRMDRAAAQAINILREPLADTFLGRKHYEPIPLPYQEEEQGRPGGPPLSGLGPASDTQKAPSW